MISRILAALTAIAMVVAAVVIRQQMNDNGDGGSGGRNNTGAAASKVICATELPDGICDDGEQPIASTADSLIAAADRRAASLGEWVTPGPWPQMVDAARASTGKPKLFATAGTVATTELVVVVARKPAQCPAEVTWACLGDAAQAAGVRISAPSKETAMRLLITAALTAGHLNTSDFASNDVTDDPAVSAWVDAANTGIDRSRAFGATSVTSFLATRGSAADAFITTAAEAKAAGAVASSIVVPTPRVKVVATAGAVGKLEARGLADGFKAAGWSTDPTTFTGATGLPSPGVLVALRELVS